jgi:hypothetical protein
MAHCGNHPVYFDLQHGMPKMKASDPFAQKVISRWRHIDE